MYFQHSALIWRDFPALVPGVLYAEGITAEAPTGTSVDRFAAMARSRLAAVAAESELPEIQAWRRAFAQMGLKPTQYRCASESLLRRFRKEGSLPALHPLVDLCNAVSLAFAVPVAVFDVAAVASLIEVRYATGDETYLTFAGDTEHPAPGEVIFADQAGHVHARRWTNRQSGLSAVRDTTATALIVAEALHDQAPDDISELIKTLAAELEAVWSVTPQATILTAASPAFTSGDLGQRSDVHGPDPDQRLVLGLLGRLRLPRAAPVASRRDRAALVRADRGRRLRQADRAVVQAVRQDHQVGGESVAAHVRGLEDLPGVPCGEHLGQRAAEPRTARVTLRVPADQVDRLADRGPERDHLPGRQPRQVERAGHRSSRPAPQPRLAPRRPGREHAVAATARPRPPDHLHPDAELHGLIDHGPQRVGQHRLGRLVRPRPGVLDQQPGPGRLGRRSHGRLGPVMALRPVLALTGHSGHLRSPNRSRPTYARPSTPPSRQLKATLLRAIPPAARSALPAARSALPCGRVSPAPLIPLHPSR
jgi:DNA/RNA-binding domain of Phe-tRNA-synthetase-like protein